jgi:hypothetical protein
VLQGKAIKNPDFNSLAKPMLQYLDLGGQQAQLQTADDAAAVDAAELTSQSQGKEQRSRALRKNFEAKFQLAKSEPELEAEGKLVTADIKRGMTTADVAALKKAFTSHLDRVRRSIAEAHTQPDEGV